MTEFNINDIWNSDEVNAKEYHDKIKSDILRKAKKRSNSILKRIETNTIYEFILGILIVIYLIVYTKEPILKIYVFSIALLIIIYSLKFFYDYKLKIKNSTTYNIKASVENYILIIKKYKKKLTYFSYLGAPIGISYKILEEYIIDQQHLINIFNDSSFIIKFIITILISLVLAYGLIKSYYYLMYNNKIKKLENILKKLNDIEE